MQPIDFKRLFKVEMYPDDTLFISNRYRPIVSGSDLTH